MNKIADPLLPGSAWFSYKLPLKQTHLNRSSEMEIFMTLMTGTVALQQNGLLAGDNRSSVLGMCTDGVDLFVYRWWGPICQQKCETPFYVANCLDPL